MGAFGVAFFIFDHIKKKSDLYKNILPYIITVAGALILCGAISLCTFYKDSVKNDGLIGTSGEYTMLVESVEHEGYISSYVVRIDELDINVLLDVHGKKNMMDIGDKITSNITFTDFDRDDGYNIAGVYRPRRVLLKAVCTGYTLLSKDNKSVTIFFTNINNELDSILRSCLDENTYPFLSALVLGNRGELPLSIKRDFARLGISHILALSGMHLAIITLMVSYLLDALKLRRQIKYVLTLETTFVKGKVCIFTIS